MNVKDAVDLTGRLTDLVKRGMTVEAQERIVELRGMLVDLSEENLQLREENTELRREKDIRENLRYDEKDAVYFLENMKDAGPYCQPCWDKEKRLSRLSRVDSYGGRWQCRVCDKHFGPEKPMPHIDPPSFY